MINVGLPLFWLGGGLGETQRAYRAVLRACEWEKIIFEDKNAGN